MITATPINYLKQFVPPLEHASQNYANNLTSKTEKVKTPETQKNSIKQIQMTLHKSGKNLMNMNQIYKEWKKELKEQKLFSD